MPSSIPNSPTNSPTNSPSNSGDELVDLFCQNADAAQELIRASRSWPSYCLNQRQLCDLDLLMNGAFSPLRGYLGREDCESIFDSLRLHDGTLWPLPISLDLPAELATQIEAGSLLALRNDEGTLLARLEVREVWKADRRREAQAIYLCEDAEHPGVQALFHEQHEYCVAGSLLGIQPVPTYDFRELRHTPRTLRRAFAERGWERVIGFQTRNPMHRAHFELTKQAAAASNAKLLLHPVVGMTQEGDIDYQTRVRCYRHMLRRYPDDSAMLSLLGLAMRMAGPREALWHALIRKNYGCTHFIVGRDHAGSSYAREKSLYGPYDAQELLREHEREAGIQVLTPHEMVYASASASYVPRNTLPEDAQTKSLSGSELRERLKQGAEIPEWFAFPEVTRELRHSYPALSQQGFALFFTGLSGAGKSSIAKAVRAQLLEHEQRGIRLLDGDLVRRNLSSELGFSREDRDTNIRRIGFVAGEVVRCGGIAICAAIAPFDAARRDARAAVEAGGTFILVHIATSLDVCEARDPKGLYAKARAGQIEQFTGISDPYEVPLDAEIVIDGGSGSPETAASTIVSWLRSKGLLSPDPRLPVESTL